MIKENYKLMQLYSPSLSVQTKNKISYIVENSDFSLDKTSTDGMMLQDGFGKTSWSDLFIAFKKICINNKKPK